MVCQPVRLALLIGAIVAVAVAPARADNAPCPTGPATRTIQVEECVPETYTVKRTRYKIECRQEEYDTCKTICVPVQQERVVTCVKKVPVMKTETRKVCKTITVNEERTVMKTCYQTVQETVMKKKLKCLGHWECVEKPTLFGHLHGNKCCDPCNPCGNNCAPKTRTHRHWVYCPQYECCPVTVCKKVCVQVPTKVCVPVCKQVWSECQVQVCTYQCVQEKKVEKCTVMVQKQVSCKATRTVRVCVPYEELVTCTRMVRRCVTREVPVCQDTCVPCCRERRHLFGHGSCDTGCDSGCRTRGHGLHRNRGCCN